MGDIFSGDFSIVPLAPSTPGGKTVAELSWCSTAVSLPLPLPKCMQCSVFLRNWFSFCNFSGQTPDVQ